MKRVGVVTEIKPECLDEYPGVRDLLQKYHLRNFRIFLQQMPNWRWHGFGYNEYTGGDFEADMWGLDREPRNIEWHSGCDPMQVPLPGLSGWNVMEPIYFNE